ncbi:MAG: hypothetical protein HYU41_08835 [Candidatus Rokubacteria bacterium]|nr:hypothetical protein [Candidatus Rokubacteria bacterium]
MERAIEAFGDKDARERFFEFVKELQTLYEIISPDAFLRDHLEAYASLGVLHEIVGNAFTRRPALYKDLARKTEALVREHVQSYGITTTLPVVRIDEGALAALKRSGGTDPGTVLNLGRSLVQAACGGDRQPYLVPIGERAEAVLEAYDDRQIGTEAALRQLERLVMEFLEARRASAESGFDVNAFATYWTLKQAGISGADAVAKQIEAAFVRYPDHRENADDRRRVKAALYKALLPAVGKDRMVEVADRILAIERR